MTTWHAGTPEALEEIGGVIHDAYFDIDHVRHDETKHMLVVPFAQEPWGPDAPQPQLVKTTWRYREERVPFMQGTLRIAAVESVEIDRAAGDAALLVDIGYDSSTRTVTVTGVSGTLAARVSRLDVSADLTTAVSHWVLRRHGRLGVSDRRATEDSGERRAR